MTKAEREAFLADVHVGILSLDDPGRGPFAVPIWYEWDGTAVVMELDDTTKKARLLRASGRAGFTVQTETAPYKYVSVEGPVTIGPMDRDPLELAVRYLGEEIGAWYAQENPPTEHSVVVRLTPEHWNTMDFGKRLGL